MNPWIVCDTADLRGEQHGHVLAWVRSLDLDPADFLAKFLIARNVGGGYQLHLSRILRGEGGQTRIDRARDEVASEPVVIDLADQSWPIFLGRWAA